MKDGSPPDSDSKRLRISAFFFVTGVLLMLWAWGSWTWRTRAAHQGSQTLGPVAQSTPEGTADAIRAFPPVLLFSFLLFLAFLMGSFVLVRSGRRRREAAARTRASPSLTGDVWSMHRLPDEPDDERVE